ncbi:hypothetical protein CDAR_210861 [Caerostris darwini]|uniref:Uncharacterized protein n=1 Tax=Caerostris darwini TaxID=1538125 RepID=A0AAV4SGY3_9ARAC|nr:hypothetical protein CDAR_210861 [Caerostris darwini]
MRIPPLSPPVAISDQFPMYANICDRNLVIPDQNDNISQPLSASRRLEYGVPLKDLHTDSFSCTKLRKLTVRLGANGHWNRTLGEAAAAALKQKTR